MHCQVDYPVKATIKVIRHGEPQRVSEHTDEISIYLEPKDMQLSAADSIINATVLGSEINKEYTLLNSILEKINKKYDHLSDLYAKTPDDAKNSSYREDLMQKINEVFVNMDLQLQQFVREHPKSFVSLGVIKSIGGVIPDTDKCFALVNLLEEPVKSAVPTHKYSEYLKSIAHLAIGKVAPSFSQADTSGKMVSLSSYQGKYVLIDFWASWCGPCRAENPNVVKCYEQYHNKGLEIMGVSIDESKDRAKWLKAVRDDKLPWVQLSDLKGWENEVARMYGIQGVPQNYLINPEGKIIAKNLRGKELHKKIGELIK